MLAKAASGRQAGWLMSSTSTNRSVWEGMLLVILTETRTVFMRFSLFVGWFFEQPSNCQN
jgi:hypothetical protein